MFQPQDAALVAASTEDRGRAPAPQYPDVQTAFLAVRRGCLTGAHMTALHELAGYLAVSDEGATAEPNTKNSLVELQAFLNIAKTKNAGGRLEDGRAALLRVAALALEAIMVLDVRIWAHTRPGEDLPADTIVSLEEVRRGQKAHGS